MDPRASPDSLGGVDSCPPSPKEAAMDDSTLPSPISSPSAGDSIPSAPLAIARQRGRSAVAITSQTTRSLVRRAIRNPGELVLGATTLEDCCDHWLKMRGGREPVFPEAWKFEAEPIKAPILDGCPAKLAIQASKNIVKYTTVPKKPQVGYGRDLVKLAIENPEVQDEIFYQLVKQTIDNRDLECLGKTWELFLIVASFVPASDLAQDDVKAHLAAHASRKGDPFAEIARFTFIRFSARCSIGPVSEIPSNAVIAKIPSEVASAEVTFGGSIDEQLWRQRRTHPELTVPLLLDALANAILVKGAERSEGLFRLSGNAARVQEIVAAINRGADLTTTLARVELNDLTQLFKSWFTALPERIIFGRYTEELMTVYETTKDYRGFIAKLPPAHANILKFLSEFLKRLAVFEPATKMSIKNYAIIFAAAIVAPGPPTDQFAAVRNTVVSQEFLLFVLRDWDPLA
jgi:hypothetical protein